ncbi:hypothetical protein Bca52824_007356 [Brassica carinata]|uniref:RNase H type-1 domain-containing protein n=1 Tax=Brassica carinata TaxID=52824 RepID=A0A8X7W9S1_BRACI|nr:hypothetical protein Bca52824_007356 [Brassica carinata]
MSYLLGLAKIKTGTQENKRAWPWVLWRLWKTRNEFLFEGNRRLVPEIVAKAKTDSEEWFLAQAVEKEMERDQQGFRFENRANWKPPSNGSLMCNIAFDWKRRENTLGAAWVVRDHRGIVLFHSRRSFVDVRSHEEAKMCALLWTSESMTSLKLNKVTFAGEFSEIFGAVLRPHAWPSFLFQREEFLRSLRGLSDWKVLVVCRKANRGASLIADSVHQTGLVQSYIASGHPAWLEDLFHHERHSL